MEKEKRIGSKKKAIVEKNQKINDPPENVGRHEKIPHNTNTITLKNPESVLKSFIRPRKREN